MNNFPRTGFIPNGSMACARGLSPRGFGYGLYSDDVLQLQLQNEGDPVSPKTVTIPIHVIQRLFA